MPETPRWQDSRWVWLLCISFSSLTLLFLAFCLYLPIYRSTTLLIPFLSKTRSRRKQNTYINFTVLIFLDFLESFFCCKEKESSAGIDINFTVFDWRFSTFVFGGRKKKKKKSSAVHFAERLQRSLSSREEDSPSYSFSSLCRIQSRLLWRLSALRYISFPKIWAVSLDFYFFY